MSFAVEWVTDATRFAELSGEWDELMAGDARPFDLHCWHMAWWQAFGDGCELAICTVRDGDALAGVFPLQRSGRDLEALANSHSGVFRPLASSPEAMDALIGAALRGTAKLTVPELREGDQGAEALAASARHAAMLQLREAGSTLSIVDTSGDFEAWGESNSSWKKKLRRSWRKMAKEYEAVFDLTRSPVDLEAELAEGFAVEASGWKGEAGTAIVSRPDTELFYRRIAASFHARGELRLSRIALNGEPAAFSYCLEHRDALRQSAGHAPFAQDDLSRNLCRIEHGSSFVVGGREAEAHRRGIRASQASRDRIDERCGAN